MYILAVLALSNVAFGFMVDTRSPEEITADSKKAVREKRAVSAVLRYIDLQDAIDVAIKAQPVVDGVALVSAKLEREINWKFAKPYADPTCGDWSVGYTRGFWGGLKILRLSFRYNTVTKKVDRTAMNMISLEFSVARSHGKNVYTLISTSADELIELDA